jgi:hypothetical protein
MRTVLSTVAAAALFAGLALAESWSGTVVDVSCAKKDLATHSRQCALGCAKSGFGLVTADGKFHKFNEAGNAKTLEALKASAKNADLKATVNGKMSGETIEVESISLQ